MTTERRFDHTVYDSYLDAFDSQPGLSLGKVVSAQQRQIKLLHQALAGMNAAMQLQQDHIQELSKTIRETIEQLDNLQERPAWKM